MALHFIMHTLIIAWAIPAILQRIKVMPREDREKLLGVRKELKDVPYARTARKTPANYFTTNWVHCLRSKYIHKHSPPVRPYFAGKETILERNVQAGVYFSGRGIVERKSIAAGFRQDLKTCLPVGVAGAIDKYGKKKKAAGEEPDKDFGQEVTLPDSDGDSLDGEGEALPDSDDSFDLLADDTNHAFNTKGERLR